MSSLSLCPFCEVQSLLRSACRRPWTSTIHTRGMATMHKRKQPSRMELSPNVARRTPKVAPSGKTIRKPSNSPFGGMNLVDAKIRNMPRNPVSQAELKRASRHKPNKAKASDSKKAEEPFKALKMQRALSPVSYGHRSSVKQNIADIDSFADFDLLPVIQESIATQVLPNLGDLTPTPVQRLAIPALLGTENKKRRRKTAEVDESPAMQQFLLAAETGSGKTLAYLLPILDAIKRAEAASVEQEAAETAHKEQEKGRSGQMFELEPPPLSNDPDPTTGRPRAIILLPTAELVAQVGHVAKQLSHTVKFRSALISSSYTGTVIRSRLFSPRGIDLLISTPHLLSSITESDPNVLSKVSHLVIDEADSLLDRSFAPITGAILDRASPSLKQLVLCSATIPRSLDSYLRKRYPDIRRLATPNLHAIPRRVQLSVVDLDKDPYKGNRDLACADTIWNVGREAAESAAESSVKNLIVFVNEREKSLEVAEYLRSKGINASALNRDADERKRADTLAEFTTGLVASAAAKPAASADDDKNTLFKTAKPNSKNTPSSSPATTPATSTPAPAPKRQLSNVKVLVMTDLGSRGIDTLLVRNVILYDVPHTSIDFIHRLGRVGRMGRRGRAFVLVGKGDRRDVVREVRDGMFRGQALI